jgi:peptide/nickel transport system substrate-binding protein
VTTINSSFGKHIQFRPKQLWKEGFMFSRNKALGILMVLLIAALMSITVIVSAQDADGDGKGGRLVVADSNSNTSLDPFVSSWHSWPHYALFPTLFSRDENLDYIGYLADTWEVSEDGTEMTITLIDFATFTDGTPVNAEAIKWNLERYANPDTGSSQGADLIGLLEEVEVVDEYTFTLHLASAYAPLFYTLSGLEIVSPTAYEELGVENFGTSPVGAGPFILKELNTDNYVLFEKNPDFTWAPPELYDHPGPVYLDEFQILFIGEEQTILSALETGEITYAGIPTQNLEDVEANPDITVHKSYLTEIRYIGFNTSKAPWDNADLRRAFAYATNREEFNTLAWNDLALPIYQPLPPTIWGHNPELDATSYHYEPETASAMLDELGYVDVDGDGLREDPEGNPWSVRISTVSADDYRRQAEVIDAQWRDLGIPVEIELLEFSALVDLTTTGTHDLFLFQYGYQDPSILTYFFDPDRKGGSNRAWFSTDELTELLIKADTDLNQETRYQTITELQQYIINESPWIFLVDPPFLAGVRSELKGWEIMPNLDFLYWNAYFEQ